MKKYISIICILIIMSIIVCCGKTTIPKDYEIIGTITTTKDAKRCEIIIQSFSSKIKHGDIYIQRNDGKVLTINDFTDEKYIENKNSVKVSSYFAFIFDKDKEYSYQIYANPKVNCDTIDAILWKPKKGNENVKFTLDNVSKDKFDIR